MGGAKEAREDAGGTGEFGAGTGIEEADGFGELLVGVMRSAGEVENATIGAGTARDFFALDAEPGTLERLGKLGLLRPLKADVNIAPAGGSGALLGFLLLNAFNIVDDVHPAEVTDGVIDDEEFAVIAAIKKTERTKTPKTFKQRMENMNLDPGGDEVIEERIGCHAGTDRIYENADVKPLLRLFSKRRGDMRPARIIEKDIRFQPDTTSRRPNIGNHGLQQRRGLDVDRKQLPGNLDRLGGFRVMRPHCRGFGDH